MSLSPPPPIVEQDAPNGLNPALKSDSEPSEPIDEPMQLDSPGKAAIKEEDPEAQLVRVAQAKQRHEDDLKKHHYEPPQAERVQDESVSLFLCGLLGRRMQMILEESSCMQLAGGIYMGFHRQIQAAGTHTEIGVS